MKIVKLSVLFLLAIAFVLGGSGCMKSAGNYKEDILTYLGAKYNEKFVIENAKKEINADSGDIIRAKVHSEEYPKIPFTVEYHLSFSDVHNKKEIIDLFKQAGAFNEQQLKEWKNDVEPYIEDDYSNILYQTKFNNSLKGKLALGKDYLIQTRFDTPNYFPTLQEGKADLNQYVGAKNYDLYGYHFLFIKDDGGTVDSKLTLIHNVLNQVSNANIKEQYLLVYFLNDFSPKEIEQKYYENYEYPDDYFAPLKTCTAHAVITIQKGAVKESNQEILDKLGEKLNGK